MSKNMKIFLYEPNETAGEIISQGLIKEGYDVTWIPELIKAQDKIDATKYDASLIEIDGRHHAGISLIKEWFEHSHKPLCVSIYYDTENTAAGFTASRLGSQEIYEVKNGNLNDLDRILQRYRVSARLPQIFQHSSAVFNKAVSDLRNLINHDRPVLLVGEPGCGKSYLAEHVINDKTNKNYKYEEVKCGSLDTERGMIDLLGVVRGFTPEIKQSRKGMVEEANEKGLLYLERIQELPAELQDVLVDILEKGRFRQVGSDVPRPFTSHVIASCNDISQINNDRFNRRLYELITPNIVKVPSLRECLADIIPNSEQIIEDFCKAKGIAEIPKLAEGAQYKLYTHTWPGNYRELKSCLESAVASCSHGIIEADDLKISLADDEKELPTDRRGLLMFYLDKFNGKKVDVMRAMETTRPTLDKWLADYDIDYKEFKKKRKPKTNRK